MPRTTFEGKKKFSLPLRGSENFFGSGTTPPPPQTQKPSYGPVVYSFWVMGWCLCKSGTLMLTLHKFIKIAYFSKVLRKTPESRILQLFQPLHPLATLIPSKLESQILQLLQTLHPSQPRYLQGLKVRFCNFFNLCIYRNLDTFKAWQSDCATFATFASLAT